MADTRLFVGTYTRNGGEGIVEFGLTPGGTFIKRNVTRCEDPSWMVAHGGVLYAGSELPEGGRVTAFAVEDEGLALLNAVETPGDGLCHFSLWPDGKHLSGANYNSGSFVTLRIDEEGYIGKVEQLVQDEGETGPDKARQDGPHAHAIVPVPGSAFFVGCDLGLDELRVFEAAAGTLVLKHTVKLRPGAGPRHIAFHPERRWAYVVCELDSTVAAFDYDAATGEFTEQGTVSTLHTAAKGNTAAEILVTLDGRFLYVSNRGEDTIAVFHISHEDGTLEPLGSWPCGGRGPRHFAIDPTGRFVVVANEGTGTLAAISRDEATGELLEMVDMAEVKGAVCAVFAPALPQEGGQADG